MLEIRAMTSTRKQMEQLVEARTADLARANTQLTQVNARLQQIIDAARALSFCNDTQAFGSLLLEKFGQHLLAAGGSIYLKEANGLRLVHALDGGHAAEFIAFPLPENSIFQLALTANKPLLVRDIAENELLKPSGWQGYTDGSALVFPLLDQGGAIVGMVTLHSKSPPPFEAQDREIGNMLAAFGCGALRTVRATEALRKSESLLCRMQDQQKLEVRLRQAQKMEALGILAGGIAHDFNNILSVVLGYSELGMLDLGDPTHPVYPKLTAINHAGRRARELVEQILAFSRMQEQCQAPIKVSPIVKEALKLLQCSLPATIQVRSEIKADKLVFGDPAQIHQIIMNLFTNAFHAMQDAGGILEVSLDEVSHDAAQGLDASDPAQRRYLQLTVADTGTGISPDIIDRIFDPDFTTKDEPKGTGLGLAVVKDIVKRHGGDITVNSRVGEGTQVAVLFPVHGDRQAVNDIHPLSLPRGTEHVLLVDDNTDLVAIGGDMLQRLGYRVTAIAGSTAALATFEQDPLRFDLVITDYTMPEMTGDRLARQILTIRPDMPIIICTGFSDAIDRQQAQAMGIKQALIKPLTMEAMAQAVHKALAAR